MDTSTVLFDSPLICRDWKEMEKLDCKKVSIGIGLVVEGTKLGVATSIVEQVLIDNVEKSTKSKEILKRKLLAERPTLEGGQGTKKFVNINLCDQETIVVVSKGRVSNSLGVVLGNTIKKGKEEMLVREMWSLIFEMKVSLNLIGINKISIDELRDQLGCDVLVDSTAGLGGAERRMLEQGKEEDRATQLLEQITSNNVLFAKSLADRGNDQMPPPTG